jgi:hypothetical protein
MPNGSRLQEIAGLIDEGKLKIFINKTYDLKEVRDQIEKLGDLGESSFFAANKTERHWTRTRKKNY